MKAIRIEYDDEFCTVSKRTINYSGEVIISIKPKENNCFICEKTIKSERDFNIVDLTCMNRIGKRIVEIVQNWQSIINKYKINESELDMAYRFQVIDSDRTNILCCKYCSKHPEHWESIRTLKETYAK